MTKTWELFKRYPLVAATLVVGLVGLIMWLGGGQSNVQILFSVYAGLIALLQAKEMVQDMFKGNFGLDILAVVAIGATLLVGEYVAALIIVLMVTGGEALEDYAAARAQRDLTQLLAKSPQVAFRVEGQDLTQITVEEVQINDLLLVRPGEIVPVDGTLEEDVAALDESSLTGEGIPVEKSRGQTLLSGSVNGQTAFHMRATSTADESQFQQIAKLVTQAQEEKAPMVRLADRYAVPFTVFALVLGGIAWAVSGDSTRFAEVLVLATPCPLLIAAPVAFIGGMSRSAKDGIIVKSGTVLEQLGNAKTVVFDKTGTLTVGMPTIVSVNTKNGHSEEELLQLAASAEQYSAHVLAASVLGEARSRGLELLSATTASEVATFGVEATIEGTTVRVGKHSFITEQDPSLTQVDLSPGELAIYISINGKYAGNIVAADQVRANAAETLTKLGKLGIGKTVMLTGDAQQTATHVATELGISQVHAEALPGDKVSAITQMTGRPVVMVGDGVNDAPALAAAEVGIALAARGATIASESADAVILVDDISKVAAAVSYGQHTLKIALQSIWVGIILSVVLMSIAAFGFIPATVGALTQEVVDLVAILAALRALGPRKPKNISNKSDSTAGAALTTLPQPSNRLNV